MLDTGKTKFEQCQKCVVAVAIPHFCFRYSAKPKNIFDTAHNCWSAHCSSHWISCVKLLQAHWLKQSQTYFFIMWHIVSITAKTKTVHAAVPFKLHSVMVDTILMKTHEPRKNGSSDFLLPWIIQYFLKKCHQWKNLTTWECTGKKKSVICRPRLLDFYTCAHIVQWPICFQIHQLTVKRKSLVENDRKHFLYHVAHGASIWKSAAGLLLFQWAHKFRDGWYHPHENAWTTKEWFIWIPAAMDHPIEMSSREKSDNLRMHWQEGFKPITSETFRTMACNRPGLIDFHLCSH